MQKLIDDLESQIPVWLATAVIPGLALAIIRDGEVGYSQAFGVAHAETQAPLTPDTVFEAASLSKPVFAYAVLKLCERGLLDLDKPLIEYLPESERERPKLFDHIINEPRLHQITTRHVLSHQTGFPNWGEKDKPLVIHFTPGARFLYSGEGYMYLQRVVAHMTQQRPQDWIQEQVLRPLGMDHASFTFTEDDQRPIATGHDDEGRPVSKKYVAEMGAAYSLHGSITDMARFLREICRPSPTNQHFLDPNTRQQMLQTAVPVSDSLPGQDDWLNSNKPTDPRLGWGLGWGTQETEDGRAVWHWGDNGVFKAFIAGYPDAGTGAVMLSNSENGAKVWRDVIVAAIGGTYPAIDWLNCLYDYA